VPTVGVLIPDSQMGARCRPFPGRGSTKLGYVEGRNIRLDIHFAEGDFARMGELAAELVRRRVDFIVPFSTAAVLAAKHATSTIPIVMTSADTVGMGIASFAHPGGNITGVSGVNTELAGKHV
jgi:putative tryptophan/tyrosine transport system substrate-binding protein